MLFLCQQRHHAHFYCPSQQLFACVGVISSFKLSLSLHNSLARFVLLAVLRALSRSLSVGCFFGAGWLLCTNSFDRRHLMPIFAWIRSAFRDFACVNRVASWWILSQFKKRCVSCHSRTVPVVATSGEVLAARTNSALETVSDRCFGWLDKQWKKSDGRKMSYRK